MTLSFVAVDTETTGLDFERDRMIEIAAVRFENGRPVAEFEALLSPGDRALSPVSRLITGLDPERLREAPPSSETLRAFADFAGNLPLVAHNADFDAHFVRRSLEAEGLPALPGAWLDSLPIARAAWPDWDNHKLDSLARRLDLERDGEHRALPDARRAGLVFLAALRTLRTELSPEAWRDLARITADLPGWNLVFDGGERPEFDNTRDEGVSSESAGVSASAATAADSDSREEACATVCAQAARDAAAAGGAHVVETPAGVDEHFAGLRAARELALASGGTHAPRALLAVPDAAAATALLRKARAARASGGGLNDGVILLGAPSDYPNRARLAALAENPARATVEERAALWPLVAAADRMPGQPVWAGRGFSPDRHRVAWSRVRCEGWGDDAAAREARARGERATVVVVTHAALCANVGLDGALLPARDALIVTGAHRLADAALESAGRRVTLFRLRDALQALRASPTVDAGAWPDIVPALSALSEADREAWKDRWFAPDRELQGFLQKAGRRAEKLRPAGDFRVRYAEHVALAFGADPAPVLDALRANEALLESVVASADQAVPMAAREARRVLSRLRDFRKDFEFLCAVGDPEWIHWFEEVANPHKAALRAVPRDTSGFGSALSDLYGARLFLSPALLSGGDADASRDARALLRGAGLLAPREEVTAQRAANEKRPRLILVPSAPQSAGSGQEEELARFLAEATGASEAIRARGVLVFCPTQTRLRALQAGLRAILPPDVPLLAQHVDGNRDAIARLYGTGRGGFVLATEGLSGLRDVDGNPPALWIVTRMPLPPPRDPVLEARGEIQRNGRELWRAAAILRLKREWHSLAKEGAPPETVWLVDARAVSDGLGGRLARAMGWEPEIPKAGETLPAGF